MAVEKGIADAKAAHEFRKDVEIYFIIKNNEGQQEIFYN